MPKPRSPRFSLRICRLRRFSGVAAPGIRPAAWPFRNSRVDRRHQGVLLAASGVQLKRALREANSLVLRRHRGENTRKTNPPRSFHFDRIAPNCQGPNLFGRGRICGQVGSFQAQRRISPENRAPPPGFSSGRSHWRWSKWANVAVAAGTAASASIDVPSAAKRLGARNPLLCALAFPQSDGNAILCDRPGISFVFGGAAVRPAQAAEPPEPQVIV
jgi:hypothetical protein